jgi:hypothetical protein
VFICDKILISLAILTSYDNYVLLNLKNDPPALSPCGKVNTTVFLAVYVKGNVLF